MATRTRSVRTEKDDLIPTPDWGEEAKTHCRAVWEIAAMAGNVMPKVAAINAKKSADPVWRERNAKLVRAMTNALLPTRRPFPDHVYYDPNQAGNAGRILETTKIRQVRVEVVSAIEFLWHHFGPDTLPEELRTIHQSLRAKDVVHSEHVATEATKEPVAATENPKGPAHRDQQSANATKETNRLKILVYILSRELYGVPPDSEFPPPTLRGDVLDSVEKAGLKRREGLGADGVQTLLEKSFKQFWQLKRNPS